MFLRRSSADQKSPNFSTLARSVQNTDQLATPTAITATVTITNIRFNKCR